jgi:hypothetical protein
VQSKLEAICKEVGRIVEKAPVGARLGLWFGLLRGCDRAMSDAPSLGKEPKVLIHLFLEFNAKSPIPLLGSDLIRPQDTKSPVLQLTLN